MDQPGAVEKALNKIVAGNDPQARSPQRMTERAARVSRAEPRRAAIKCTRCRAIKDEGSAVGKDVSWGWELQCTGVVN